jgi:hypothetical protein
VKPLPPPVEPAGLPSAADLDAIAAERKAAEQTGGLFGLGNIFQSPQPSPEPDFLPASYHASSTGGSEPLGAEAERILASVPEHIGDTAGEPGEPQPGAPISGAEHVQVDVSFPPAVLTAENLRTILTMGFKGIAAIRKRECYKLESSEACELAGLWVDIVNRNAERLLPAFATKMGLDVLVAILGSASIIGPKLLQDIEETTAARKAVPMVREGTSHGPAIPSAPRSTSSAVQWASEAA